MTEQVVVRYKVTVSAIIKRKKLVGGDWTKVEERLAEDGKTLIPKFGHTPMIEKEIEEEVPLFEQRPAVLDVREVILAVNGMPTGRT